jgi:opacity protein-like surface antigen
MSKFTTWLATASVEWIPTHASSVKLTFNHDLGFDPGSTWSLYGISRLSLEGKTRLNTLLTAALAGDWAQLTYRDAAKTTSSVLTVKPSLKADVARWLSVELSYQYTNRTTELALASRPPGWQFSRHEVWLRSLVTY